MITFQCRLRKKQINTVDLFWYKKITKIVTKKTSRYNNFYQDTVATSNSYCECIFINIL